jgi:hypothetical protein
VLVSAGLAMVVIGGDVATPLGTAFLALGLLGLFTGGAGLLVERVTKRRPPPPPDVRRANGHGPAPRV